MFRCHTLTSLMQQKSRQHWSHGSLIRIPTLRPETWNSNSNVGWGSCSQGIHIESWWGYYLRPHWYIFFPPPPASHTTHSIIIIFLFGAGEQKDGIDVSRPVYHGFVTRHCSHKETNSMYGYYWDGKLGWWCMIFSSLQGLIWFIRYAWMVSTSPRPVRPWEVITEEQLSGDASV